MRRKSRFDPSVSVDDIIESYHKCEISITDAVEELKLRGMPPKESLAKLDRSYNRK